MSLLQATPPRAANCGSTVSFHEHCLWIRWRQGSVAELSFHPPDHELTTSDRDFAWIEWHDLPRPQRDLAERLADYFSGEEVAFDDIELDLAWCTTFQRRVLDACRAIPYGEVRTYGQLARDAGSPRASRAVGNVMRMNRFPIIVPCHRVVRSSGGLGGFSAPSGVRLKQRLLDLEGIEL